jgi:metal-responsive CopG/Arc/MetJ family transcriptional regulator
VKRQTATRTSTTFPSDLWRGIESDRKRRGVPRSRWLQDAAREYLARHSEAEREARYFAGYTAIPDATDAQFTATQGAAIHDLRATAHRGMG